MNAHNLSTEPTTALEIGCDGGRYSKLLINLGWKLIFTDINEKALKICKKRIPKADCILITPNESKIPCESRSINLLLCIEIAPVNQATWFIHDVFRVIQNGGLIVGMFWNLFSYRALLGHLTASFRVSIEFYENVYSF